MDAYEAETAKEAEDIVKVEAMKAGFVKLAGEME